MVMKMNSNFPSVGTILLVSFAIMLSFLAMLMSANALYKANNKPPKVVEKVVYKNLVPINAMLLDANSVVVVVELNYEHDEHELMYVKRSVKTIASKFMSDQRSLVEENITADPRIKQAWVYFKHIVIKAE